MLLYDLESHTRPFTALLDRAMVFKPVIVGGQDITSLRAHFDDNDRNIIVASNRQLLYYSVRSGNQKALANIPSSRLEADEFLVACDKFETNLYLFTNNGKMFIWSLETRDWANELDLPIDAETESLVSCKMLSRKQYVFSTKDRKTNETKLFISMARSERDRPKSWDLIGECSTGLDTDFDIGCSISGDEIEREKSKTTRDKLRKQRILVFIKGSLLNFQKVGVGEKFALNISTQTISNHKFTCVRASQTRPMVAAGDSYGRIYIYSGNYNSDRPWENRSKMHWHSSHVSDLSFSSTGQTLYSVGAEAGCVVVWDLSANGMGEKRIIANLGMPIRHVNCSEVSQRLILSFEDNEIRYLETDRTNDCLKTMSRRTYDIYLQNDYKALRLEANDTSCNKSSVGLLWHSKTDTLVTNSKTGWLQFYSARKQTRTEMLDLLKTDILSLEPKGRVLPSEITKAAFSADGDWLAAYETREADKENMFAEVRLHIWQRSNTLNKWFWIQTADRVHSTAAIADLKFSPDGQYLVSVARDGTFNILYRISLDAKSASKQMYAKGFFGNVAENMACLAAFSQDSSVLAISLKNETTLIWMISDPYKLEFECELNSGQPVDGANQSCCDTLGLHFGQHETSRNIAPLCEVRSKYIRIRNILNAQSDSEEMAEYLAADAGPAVNEQPVEFTAAAFSQTLVDRRYSDHFAVSTNTNLVLIFELKINENSRQLQPMIIVDGTIPRASSNIPRYFTDICFLNDRILEMDNQCHPNPFLLKLLNRLCLFTNHQELISFTDKLTLERQLAKNSCNEIKDLGMSDIQAYFSKIVPSIKNDSSSLDVTMSDQMDSQTVTEKQRRIKHKLQVQRMLKDLFHRVPSHNLPKMDILGPMILDKLVIN